MISSTSDSEDDHSEGLGDESDADEGSDRQASMRAITGRGVTVAQLLSEGYIEPGERVMSIEYLGRKFIADLLEDGRIHWSDDNLTFNSPSSWAIHCKKLINPDKKSGCGWASVKYKGKKLDAYKTDWVKHQKKKLQDEFDSEVKENGSSQDESIYSEIKKENGAANPVIDVHVSPKKEVMDIGSPQQKSPKFTVRRSVKHSTLGTRSSQHHPHKLVEPLPFGALGKIQPFTISISSNCLLLLDFHCHVTTSEVVGYLGGKWDPNTQHLSIMQAFPCHSRLGDSGTHIEMEIRCSMERRGLQLVGWYHSHPTTQPDPSLQDIDAQMDYQLKMKDGQTYLPCVGLIVSPYDECVDRRESQMRAFWVMPPPEQRPNEYGMPMDMVFTASQDIFLSQDALDEMKFVTDFYRGAPDMVNFFDLWREKTTFLDKLKGSLGSKFPKDQTDGRFLEYIHNILICT